MDKVYAKIIFEKAGIPQADYLYFTRKEIADDFLGIAQKVEDKFSYPVFVKPSNAGSSVGVSKAADRNDLKRHWIMRQNMTEK